MEGWDNDECFSNYTELHSRIAPKMFFKKCQSQPLFNLFSSFHTNITTKYMWKNVHPWDSNTGLSGPQPPPITTRPGLPPQKMFYNTSPKLFCRRRPASSEFDRQLWVTRMTEKVGRRRAINKHRERELERKPSVQVSYFRYYHWGIS